MILANKFLPPQQALSVKSMKIYAYIKRNGKECSFESLLTRFPKIDTSELLDILDFLFCVNMIKLEKGRLYAQ